MRKSLKYFILTLPGIFCILVFFLNLQLPEDFPIGLYLANFVHGNVYHLSGNVIAYFVFAILSYKLFSENGKERLYWLSVIVIFLISPAWTFLTLFLFNLRSIGFSGVTSAFVGLYAFSIVILLEKRFSANVSVSYLFVLFVGILPLLVVYGYYAYYFITLLILAILFRFIARPIMETGREEKLLVLLMLVLYLVAIVGLFPQQIVQNGSVVNILAHWVGFMAGYIIPWVLNKVVRG